MKAVVSIHDDGGRMLAELTTAHNVDRLFTLSGKGAFSFDVNASDPGASRDTLLEGRPVVIWSPVLPPYVGYIQRIEENTFTRVLKVSGDNLALTLYERVLPLNCTFLDCLAGGIAMQLLALVNSTNFSGVLPLPLTELGSPILGTFDASNGTLGDMLDELADKTGNEWWVEQRVERNRLVAYLHWGARGRNKSLSILLEEGIHFTKSEYARDALGYTQAAIAVGGTGAMADRPTGSGTPAQTSTIGPALARETVQYLPLDSDVAVLTDAAQTAMDHPTTAKETLALTINDVLDWGSIEPGDYVSVLMVNAYFGGVERLVRILAIQPDEAAGECDLAVEVE